MKCVLRVIEEDATWSCSPRSISLASVSKSRGQNSLERVKRRGQGGKGLTLKFLSNRKREFIVYSCIQLACHWWFFCSWNIPLQVLFVVESSTSRSEEEVTIQDFN